MTFLFFVFTWQAISYNMGENWFLAGRESAIVVFSKFLSFRVIIALKVFFFFFFCTLRLSSYPQYLVNYVCINRFFIETLIYTGNIKSFTEKGHIINL